ncbi:pentatricopeptide repeat-containing protein At2g02980, chloroplastic-like [Aristolochia californica]|uniref:pentatricopeptide repeat-containing protein At2g02980, chloroplastic-like n=1 Tax=Aristolochia californica TaxID=171875 RepID=UPI0035E2D259
MNKFSFPSLLKASGRVFGIEKGMEMHGVIVKMGVDSDEFVQRGLIGCYALQKVTRPREALRLFNEMQVSGIKPDLVTMLSGISACVHLGAQDQAKWVHIFVDRDGFGNVLSVKNALIDM